MNEILIKMLETYAPLRTSEQGNNLILTGTFKNRKK